MFKHKINVVLKTDRKLIVDIIKSQSRIVDRLKKEICLYKVEILEGKYKNQQLWFSEAEIKKH